MELKPKIMTTKKKRKFSKYFKHDIMEKFIVKKTLEMKELLYEEKFIF